MNAVGSDNNICFFMEQKVSLFTQYLFITKTIKEVLTRKKEVALNELLDRRQNCIHKIQQIDNAFQQTIKANTTTHNRLSGTIKGLFNGYLSSAQSLMEQIVPIDKEVMEILSAEHCSIRNELLKMNTVRQAAKGYNDQGSLIPRYLDTKR